MDFTPEMLARIKTEKAEYIKRRRLIAERKLYDIKDSYPSAPKDSERRKQWVDQRNAQIRNYRSGVKTIGAGVPPKEK